jgi:hypothetical protein
MHQRVYSFFAPCVRKALTTDRWYVLTGILHDRKRPANLTEALFYLSSAYITSTAPTAFGRAASHQPVPIYPFAAVVGTDTLYAVPYTAFMMCTVPTLSPDAH